ncbi:hypothetical protein BGX27_009955 [Mortierella sp. AM989]|nr:hypothetical protein BGX27_009955 [Mortierella sp. AM989]
MLRITTTTAVRTFKPTQVSVAACRNYTDFAEKERAEEAKYIRAKDAEQIKKLREKIAQAEKQVEEIKLKKDQK